MSGRLAPLRSGLKAALGLLPSELRRTVTLQSSWPNVVGSDIAAHCVPLELAGDVLRVRTDSEAWGRSLRRLAPRILPELALACGTPISRIDVTVVPKATQAPAPQEQTPDPTPAVASLPEPWLREVAAASTEVRDALRGMLQAYANAHFPR